MKLIDLTGKRFGRLTVVKRDNDRIEPSGRKRVMWTCLCDCGNYSIVSGDALKQGTSQSCGCLANELSAKRKEHNLKNMNFGRWTVIEEAFRDSFGIHWLCKCECGNQKEVLANNLVRGISKSCGCYEKELKTKREKKEITGQRFGSVVALECVGQNKYKNYLWKCLCDCGTTFVVPASRLITGETQSCGHVHSRGEERIATILNDLGIKFDKDVTYLDLKLNGLLKFDFRIYGQDNSEHLIEFQGIQHYKEFSNGFGTQQRLITDPMKKEYCIAKNIILHEIRYDQNLEEELNKIIAQVNPVLSSQETA